MAKFDARKNRGGNWLGLVVFLMLMNPALIPLGIIGGIIYVIVKSKEGTQRSTTTTTRTVNGSTRTVTRTTTRTTRRDSFDECPQPFFCFHRDKGEHHVKRGKEIDPWDRPDIDISKYQRKE